MPELPEVETIKRQLSSAIGGLSIAGVIIRRADVVSGDHNALIGKKIKESAD